MSRIGITKIKETEYLVCVDNDELVFVFDNDALCLDEPASFMWSVNWLCRYEAECIDLKSFRTPAAISGPCRRNDLSDYLLLCSDASKFHLFEFTRRSDGDGFVMTKAATQSVKFNVMMAMRSDYLRVSLAKKLDGLPVVVAAIQNSDTLVFVLRYRVSRAASTLFASVRSSFLQSDRM